MRWDSSLDFRSLRSAYRKGTKTPSVVAADVLRRITAYGDKNVYTYVVPEENILAQAREAERRRKQKGAKLPLYGLPFAIKDNIHVAGHPTSCACDAYRHVPTETSTIVQRAMEAGAILIGKLNLDQFANGLVGIRCPSGYCVNSFNSAYIPGGSSSGSGVAVAAGLAAFTFGSDTGGSGRIPAALNNVVGLKPTRGFFSNTGSVSVNRTIDCLSVFALTCEDAYEVFEAVRGYDPADRYSREVADDRLVNDLPKKFRFGIPAGSDLTFFGDKHAKAGFVEAVNRMATLGGKKVEIDFTPFREAGPMLFSSPFIAERVAGVKDFYLNHADQLHPVTRAVISAAATYSAIDTFDALHRLKGLERQAKRVWRDIDILMVPTAGTIPTIQAVEADPVRRNTEMGYYTYFVNLLDLCALAIPATLRPDGLPFGVCLIAPAGKDAGINHIGREFVARGDLPLGATGFRLGLERKPKNLRGRNPALTAPAVSRQ